MKSEKESMMKKNMLRFENQWEESGEEEEQSLPPSCGESLLRIFRSITQS